MSGCFWREESLVRVMPRRTFIIPVKDISLPKVWTFAGVWAFWSKD